MNFTIMTTSELINYVKSITWSRSIRQLHVHHTWKPDHSDYNGTNGLALQMGMRDYHVNANGWKDIGQHLTLLPDGQWITGRDFNTEPASIQGWNSEAFCIEMLGNFDMGCDAFGGIQAEAMFEFCAFFATQMKLNVESDVKFHRDHPAADKTCPGSGINREWFMDHLTAKIQGLPHLPKEDEAWKLRAVDELAAAGLLNQPQMWKDKINDPMPVWAVLTVIHSVFENLSSKK